MSSHPSPGPSTQSVSSRHKQKPHTVGIAAGAEDAKYQAKYKDLKRKVKEIETDNDKLHFKVLQAKRSIQRMKLERAVLYERLSGTSTPIDVQNRHNGPPSMHSAPGAASHPPFSRSLSGNHHYQDIGDNHPSMESERPMAEYGHPHDRPRMASGLDGRPAPAMAMGPGIAPPPHMPGIHSPPRRTSGGPGHESSRHLPPPPPLGHSRSHVSPTIHHSHSGSSHEHTRSHSSSRSRAHQQQYIHGQPQQYTEGLPAVQQVVHSPPLLERKRSSRHDNHEALSPHVDPHQHGRLTSFMPRLSPPPHPSEPRSSGRVHNHQRMSPGPYMNREDPYERQRGMDSEREREWERDREREYRDRERERDRDRNRDLGHVSSSHVVSPPIGHRSRQQSDRGDYNELHGSSRMRDEPVHYRDAPPGAAGYPMPSRSGSPVSGSGSGNGAGDGPSRPDSRPYYEQHDRTRSYRLRPVNPPNEDMDFVHEDGRSMSSRDRGGGGAGTFPPPPEQSRSSLDSRKRGRNDMDVDSDDAGEGPVYPSGRAEDRGKRYRERRSVDNQEEGRMGPP